MSRLESSRRSRRVSSAAMTSAPASASRNRGVASPGLPMGVAASTSGMAPIVPCRRRRMTLPTMTRMAVTYADAGVASPDAEGLARIKARLLRPLPADGLWGWVFPGLVAGIAAFMRFWHLGKPSTVIFDEVYYEHDAWSLLHHGVELDKNSHDQAPGFVVHPPLGKWFIAVGEAIFGHNAL